MRNGQGLIEGQEDARLGAGPIAFDFKTAAPCTNRDEISSLVNRPNLGKEFTAIHDAPFDACARDDGLNECF